MHKFDFLDAMGRIDEELIEECLGAEPKPQTNRRMNLRVLIPAACIAMLLIAITVVIPFSRRGEESPLDGTVEIPVTDEQTSDEIHVTGEQTSEETSEPVEIINENGFYIENGVLLSYSGDETEIVIPDTVYTIDDNAFASNSNASQITSVTLGANVSDVKLNAFAGLESMVELAVADENASFVEDGDVIISADGSLILRYTPAVDGEPPKSYDMPDTVRFIAAHAFQSCALEQIEFSDNLLYIGYNAFAGSALRAIYLPESVVELADGAFSSCVYAVDGSVPEGVKIGEWTFWGVPFYMTLLAGEMSPAEEIRRGLVTPVEAIQKSNKEVILDQINCFLASYNGIEYESDGVGKFGYSAFGEAAAAPEDIYIPEKCDFDSLKFVGEDWDSSYVKTILELEGGCSLVVEMYLYGQEDYLYWKDVKWRAAKVYFVGSENSSTPDEYAEPNKFGWSASFEMKDGQYSAIVFTNTDGTVIRSYCAAFSDKPYILTYSPDGNRCAVEWFNSGRSYFYVQGLDGERFEYGNGALMNFVEYINRYFGEYEGETLYWIDNDTLGGVNEFGKFSYNLYVLFPVQLEEEEFDSFEKQTVSDTESGWTVYMQIPASWRDRGYYSDPEREKANADNTSMFLPGEIMRNGAVLDEDGNWRVDNLREWNWIKDDSKITYGDTGSGYDYMCATSYWGENGEIREHDFFIKLSDSVAYYFTMYEYDDGYSPEGYYINTILPVLRSFSAIELTQYGYDITVSAGLDFNNITQKEELGGGVNSVAMSFMAPYGWQGDGPSRFEPGEVATKELRIEFDEQLYEVSDGFILDKNIYQLYTPSGLDLSTAEAETGSTASGVTYAIYSLDTDVGYDHNRYGADVHVVYMHFSAWIGGSYDSVEKHYVSCFKMYEYDTDFDGYFEAVLMPIVKNMSVYSWYN